MNRIYVNISIIFILLLSSSANAEEKLGPVSKAFVIEGLFIANSWLASEDPNTYGGIAALLFPLAAGEGEGSTTTKWVGFLSAETIALYNLDIDEDKKSKSEIFKENLIAWHVFAALVGFTGFIMGDFDSDVSLSMAPIGGDKFVFLYKRKF